MNCLDIIIISVMLFFIIRGICRGILKEVVSLAGIVGGIWFANSFQPILTAKLRHSMPGIPFLSLLSFIALLVGVIVVANIIGSILKSLVQKGSMGMVDRLLGAGLATAKGLIVTYLGIVLLTFFLPAKTPLIAKSTLAPIIVSSYQNMISLVSPNFYKKWKERFSEKSQIPPHKRKSIPSSKNPENGRK